MHDAAPAVEAVLLRKRRPSNEAVMERSYDKYTRHTAGVCVPAAFPAGNTGWREPRLGLGVHQPHSHTAHTRWRQRQRPTRGAVYTHGPGRASTVHVPPVPLDTAAPVKNASKQGNPPDGTSRASHPSSHGRYSTILSHNTMLSHRGSCTTEQAALAAC